MIWELNMEGWVGIRQARLRSEDIQKEETSRLKDKDTASWISDPCCRRKILKQKVGTENAGEMGRRQKALRGFVPNRWWFIKTCRLRVKWKQSQSFCNVSCQPSLIAFYPVVENDSRDMSKSIYSILSCLPNITTNTNKFNVHWIPLCNWIGRVVALFLFKKKA